ncbi:MAG: hypothetical protein ABJL17_16270 [Parvibaculum sp.]|uniref:hypothetical protein n=1 Tax=Parvibaculum sp. TaxID=2024848 RepID=UPI003263846A
MSISIANFDLASIASLSLGALIGAATSWAISNYFFHRETRAEQIADQIKVGLQNALFPILYPSFFDPEKALSISPEQPLPEDTDIPHAEYVIFGARSVVSGQKIDVLIKLRDSGFDLVTAVGVSLRDHRGNSIEILPIGLGYVRAAFRTFSDDLVGVHKLTIALKDLGSHSKSGPNKNVQTFKFVIEQGGYDDQRYKKS